MSSTLCAALEHTSSCSCSFCCCSAMRMFDTGSQAPCRCCSLRSPLQRRSPRADLAAATFPSRGITTSWCPLTRDIGGSARGRAGEEARGGEVHQHRAASGEVAGAATPASPAAPGSQGPVESSPVPRYPGLELPRPLRPQSRLRWGSRGRWRPTSARLPGWP